jgi:hypothetical protein
MKYRNIKSVAHNIGHSFLSDMNAVGSGGRYTIVPELLFRAAEREAVPFVRVDLLAGTVEPPSLALPEVREAVGYYVRRLPELLATQNVTPSAVTGARLTIEFDHSQRRVARYHPEVSIPEFTCVVELTDDRSAIHHGRPDNWWYS